MKYFIYVIVITAITLVLVSNKNAKGEEVDMDKSNVVKINGRSEFKKGTLENVKIEKDTGGYFIKVLDRNKSGIFTTDEYLIDEFTDVVVSWNAEMPLESKLEIEGRVFVEDRVSGSGKWSDWLSWGEWGLEAERSSDDTKCNIAEISTDVLSIKNSNEYIGKKIQLRAKLYSSDKTPILRQVTFSYKNKSEIEVFNYNNISIDYKQDIKTPAISQYSREKSIANKICSPTSITMMLNRMGEELAVEDVAWKCYDYKYEGFGNWVFNTAYAGSLGYESYVEYGNIYSIVNQLEKGYPVAVSVKYSNDINDERYPYIENAPVTTSGHLLVVVGITEDDKGEMYIVVNDPAGKNNEEVNRYYKIDQFLNAWNASNNVMYVINKR